MQQRAVVDAFGTGFGGDAARRVVVVPTPFRGLGSYLHGILSATGAFQVAEARL